MKSHKTAKRFLLGLIIFCLMFISFAAGSYSAVKRGIINDFAREEILYLGEIIGKYNKVSPDTVSQDVDFELFWEAWDALKEQYVDRGEINEKKMFYGAIRGMVASLGDPYTVFMDPKIAKDFNDDLAGTFEGIGAEIGIKNDVLTVIAPLPDMPAEIVGLKSGDKILAIDKEPTVGMSIEEAVMKIRGPKDSQVVLSIHREGFGSIKEYAITRGKIIVKSVRTELKEDNVFVIKIINFNEDTEQLFNRAVREAALKDPQGIILDLRNNPGGFLDTAIEVASEWVEDGLIVKEKYSDKLANEHLARGRARLKTYPTVILVNEGSASASEIVAGALRDHGIALIVGKKTFGKGSVQTLTNFKDGSSIKITVAKWITPSGHSINDEGITPDEVIELTVDDYNSGRDPQMDRAIEILTGKKIIIPELSAISTTTATSTSEIESE